ncbi:SRP1/TIP1 family protein CYBJADRAFT_161237 [Cyberlindnera jadinii NRRL Y-1542]|uniref:Temperature shock-inducible protein 1 n=1 Tax=Cyberlindnera jadinii (strain ATCC 18201 / CBS 1600 / BCRC 20928 / JCM 3617 / NBRC 0987 / NRRL Y-1542) TaxID=983966 RepID=A0A1E4S5K3_CYBJN|nr:hypothetical protein CYBJADRAFT_161237 [Cyberlindnera jadinii NRRL Y-1542]ODV74740.1 hypothetical protein CYBJADRAFT_161237 [Cyberlindnera jadinii NRRL Y-1542]
MIAQLILALLPVALAQDDTAEQLNAIVSDLAQHSSEYLQQVASGNIPPAELLSLAQQVQTYTDDSYTTLYSEVDMGEVTSYVTGLPWYSSRLETYFGADAAVATDDESASASASESASASASGSESESASASASGSESESASASASGSESESESASASASGSESASESAASESESASGSASGTSTSASESASATSTSTANEAMMINALGPFALAAMLVPALL